MDEPEVVISNSAAENVKDQEVTVQWFLSYRCLYYPGENKRCIMQRERGSFSILRE